MTAPRTDYRSTLLARMFQPAEPSAELEALVRRVVHEVIDQLRSTPTAPVLTGRRPKIAQCIDLAAGQFGVSREQMLGPCRLRDIARARWAAWWVARETTGQSFTVIGRKFNRSHSTVVHGVAEARTLYGRDPDFTDNIDAMFEALRVAQ